MTDKEALEAFGKELMHEVRDNAIGVGESMLAGRIRAPRVQDLQKRLQEYNPAQKETAALFLRDVVNCVLHDFLFLLQRDERITVVLRPEGNCSEEVDLAKASDALHTELFTDTGWIARYSKYPPSEEA